LRTIWAFFSYRYWKILAAFNEGTDEISGITVSHNRKGQGTAAVSQPSHRQAVDALLSLNGAVNFEGGKALAVSTLHAV
jgi:hypothetical protein